MNREFIKNVNIIFIILTILFSFVYREYSPILMIIISIFNLLVLVINSFQRFCKKILLTYNLAYISWILLNIFTYEILLKTDTILRKNWLFGSAYILPLVFLAISITKLLKKTVLTRHRTSVIVDIAAWSSVIFVILLPFIREIKEYSNFTYSEMLSATVYFLFLSYVMSASVIYVVKVEKHYLNGRKYSNLMISSLLLVLGNFVCILRMIYGYNIFALEVGLYLAYIVVYVLIVNSFMWDDSILQKLDHVDEKFDFVSEIKIALFPAVLLITLYIIGQIYLFTLMLSFLFIFSDLNINLIVYSSYSKDLFVSRINKVNYDLEKKIKNQTDELIETKDKLLEKVNTDYLTGLYSLEYFYTAFDEIIAKDDGSMSIILINIDDFRNINNTYTYLVGDKLLCDISDRLTRNLPEDVLIFRLSGDEFAVMFEGVSLNKIKKISLKIMDLFSKPFHVNEHNFLISISLSSVRCPLDSKNPRELIQLGAIAMYQAKKGKSDNLIFYSSDFFEEIHRKSEVESVIRRCELEKSFVINHWCRFDSSFEHIEGVSVGLSSLLPELKDSKMREIILVAEQIGVQSKLAEIYVNLIEDLLENWYLTDYLSTVCLDIEFRANEFILIIHSMLNLFERRPELKIGLEFYISSDMLKELNDDYNYIFDIIQENNIRLSIKNFGVGFASFNIIKKCGVTGFIVSKQLLDTVDFKKEDYNVVKSIVEIGRKLEIDIIAVGVSRISQVEVLSEFGINYYQGSYITDEVMLASSAEMLNG